MDRARIFRLLRIAFSAVCGIHCLLLIVFWVRSYQSWERILYASPGQVAGIGYTQGIISVGHSVRVPPEVASGWNFLTASTVDSSGRGFMGFYFLKFSPSGGELTAPISFLALCVAALAAAPWLRWSNRFSLRSLLIATTLVAVVLGVIMAAITD